MASHHTGEPPEHAVSGSLTPTVKQVTQIVREWVQEHARHTPNFAGAYLWGGITALPSDARFPLYRDVDVVVVLTEGPAEGQEDTQEVFYRGVMLEVLLKGLAVHRDVEAVLSNPSQGPNMADTMILADPTGLLLPLQQEVIAQFGRQRWVKARCEVEKSSAEKHLAAMQVIADSTKNQNALWEVWGLLSALSGLLAVAQLERPTTRRTISLLGELLDRQGKPDLHEEALSVWGSVHMSRDEVQAMLDETAIVFDRSVQVYQTPTPYGFTMREHLRPYLTEATQEMIEEGLHREATFWIVTLATESYLVLQNDAPDEEKPIFAAQLQGMLTKLGYGFAGAWAERVAAAEHLAREVYAIAEELVTRYPE